MAKLSKLLVLLVILSTVTLVHCGKIASLSKSQLCMFLPPRPGGNIADHEDDAIAFCDNTKDAPGAKKFPDGFIKTRHFKAGDGFIQYTGRMDRDKYKLSKNDEGGQFDTRAPNGAKCRGFKNFVNLVEPNDNIYCIRCCTDTSKCDVGRSEDGCESVIPGDYS